MADFLKQFGDIFETENYFSTIELAEWFWPQKNSTSLFECIKKAKEVVKELDKFIAGYVENVASILEANFADVLDEEERAAIKKGFATGSEVELVVVAEIESW
jgi:enamine deaminase RidA (YjgF/YER057c/UK114 family)